MKGIMITAPCSGSGKTMITIGIIRALINMGIDVCGFKTGPDYIDSAFIKAASKKNSGNLDMHLQGREGLKKSLGMGEGEFCVIEGAMGYFDGIYNTYQNSSYDIARELKVNSILIYTPKGEMFSAIPKIKGMADFEGSQIKGIIINKVGERIFKLLKEQIEKYTGLYVLGYIPQMEDIEIESRHLGLLQSSEVEDMEQRIEKLAYVVRKNIDMERLIKLMEIMPCEPLNYPQRKNINVAIAMDKAFSFYYRENLKLFEKCCNVEYFSPLIDSNIPKCDFFYLGGGYPEVFKEQLSSNKSMLSSIKSYADNGGCIYAECGGLMYLMEYIEDSRMSGVFKGNSILKKSLQRFGYIDIEIQRDCMLGKKGDVLKGHEFHKSITNIEGDTLYNIKKTMGEGKWCCGYTYKNVVAGYPHISFLGSINSFISILDYAQRKRKGIQTCI